MTDIMAGTGETVRVFVSSTFRDMHAERDHLVTIVFPELRERIEQLGLDFFDVDLRWGVPEKDASGETANSWEYCRQWIDRVEPFFVCILGQRYGWVPEARDFKNVEDKVRQEAESRSITDLEVRHALLDDRKKRHSYFYLREAEAPETASEYVDPPLALSKLAQLNTEVRSCGRPVRYYPCEWTGSSFAGMEEFGRRVLDDLWSGVLRDERYVSKSVWRQVLGTEPDTDPRYSDESQPVPHALWDKSLPSPSRNRVSHWTRSASRWRLLPSRGCAGSKGERTSWKDLRCLLVAQTKMHHALPSSPRRPAKGSPRCLPSSPLSSRSPRLS